ncbi:MAG TPA: hypothetical protein VD839_04400, partial [Burkholderiales bacterium]|nr:hypothetical protein [Burkholderiales bacterium]
MSTRRIVLQAVLAFSASIVLAGLPVQAPAADNKVVIVTSFPKDLTGKFKTEFEKHHPGITVEILN